ncbi:cAMP and cAMP-inhibited cGMP 3, 5 -cyclic phosphodiesterase 10A-like [Paramuricea clavata]|uniref:cAMP and cAMP-inhibited cGMP 3,5 -cyclic phosphodiesterase 10A-like n=1 Tax=Paramuricea clavata TaxID=317549 RepID=A0A6S7H178_PARCT|nr:cAMP and cAMP-inhibited cGMP 3, 5 -cyclic phosphodiesterase 10A-like [Paramuricea clavata]
MSSPTKQVSARRLPPLPSQNPGGKVILRSPKTTTDVEEREALLSNVDVSSSNAPRTSSQDNKQQKMIEVVDFLKQNPKALENYVMESISREQLEKWLIRKIHAQKSDTNEKNSEHALSSLSRWKFCVHTDKQKTLQHLTQEIHRQPQKAKVMYELVKCIALATHADRFSLYLICKNEKEIYLYTEDSEQRTTQVNQQKIVEGTTVCAYVASTMAAVHVRDILGDERFSDGIGIEDSMAQSVICQPIIQSDGKLAGMIGREKRSGRCYYHRVPTTIREWNKLSKDLVNASSLPLFKAKFTRQHLQV